MRVEQYQDKIIDRMDKMTVALNRISKALERFGILMDELEERFNQMESEMGSEQVEENE